MNSPEEKAKAISEDNYEINRCPDYDSECGLVKDHLQCFLGLPVTCSNGTIVETGIAKGYCPFIHPTN